jgi:hypothetical protein
MQAAALRPTPQTPGFRYDASCHSAISPCRRPSLAAKFPSPCGFADHRGLAGIFSIHRQKQAGH